MPTHDFSQRTRRLLAGSSPPCAASELHDLVHAELHAMAQRFMADQRPNHTLQPTALVNEAWMKVAGAGISAESRLHFLAVASKAMRSVLVDHARRRLAQRRGEGAAPRQLDQVSPEARDADSSTLLDLEEILVRLAQTHSQAARVAEMRIFGGMNHAETAAVLDVSVKTVERLWSAARAALGQALAGGSPA